MDAEIAKVGDLVTVHYTVSSPVPARRIFSQLHQFIHDIVDLGFMQYCFTNFVQWFGYTSAAAVIRLSRITLCN